MTFIDKLFSFYYYTIWISLYRCEGQVEVWLNRLLDTMRCSIRFYMTDAVKAYEEKARDQWLFDYPAQVSLCGTQIWWTSEVRFSKMSRLDRQQD